jgi:hypothetical protein
MLSETEATCLTACPASQRSRARQSVTILRHQGRSDPDRVLERRPESIVPSQTTRRKHHNVLSAVSCVSAAPHGRVATPHGITKRKTLAAGHRVVDRAESKPALLRNELFGVSCSAVSSCTTSAGISVTEPPGP